MPTSDVHIHPLSVLGDNNRVPLPTPVLQTAMDPNKEQTVAQKVLSKHRLHPAFAAKYWLGQELGSGGFGFVVSAYDRYTRIERAVKFIYRSRVPSSAWIRDDELGLVPMEIYVLRNVRHANIIGYIDTYKDNTFFYLVMEIHGKPWHAPPTPTPALVMPPSPPLSPSPPSPAPSMNESDDDSDMGWLSEQGMSPLALSTRRTSYDLFECIEQHHHLEEALAKKVFRQIADCIAHLDMLGICHRDIKDENIVIDSDYKVKLIDFGSAVLLPRHYGQRRPHLLDKFYGTLTFASPEILLNKPYRAEPAEIWALGVLLYTMVFGQVPFTSSSMAIAARPVRPKNRVSMACLDLIACMLERVPEKRLNIHQVLAHPWLRG